MVASMAAGAFGGMPATGRHCENSRQRAFRCRTASPQSFIHCCYRGSSTWPPGPVSAIPLSALAGVLVVTSFRMISLKTVRQVLRSTKSGCRHVVPTAVVTVCFDLTRPWRSGILFAAFFALRVVARRSSVVRESYQGRISPATNELPCYALTEPYVLRRGTCISNAITGADRPEGLRRHHPDVVSRDARRDGAHPCRDRGGTRERGIVVIIKGVQPQHINLLTNIGVIDALRHENPHHDCRDDDATIIIMPMRAVILPVCALNPAGGGPPYRGQHGQGRATAR